MKQAVMILFASVLINGMFLWADDKNPLYENVVIETFDGVGAMQYPKHSIGRTVGQDGAVKEINNEGQDIVWRVGSDLASRYAKEEFPASTYIENWPIDLHGLNPENREELRVLGVRSKFDRQGYNYFAVYVGAEIDGEWKAQPLPLSTHMNRQGIIKNISMWVWGAGFNYTLEVHVRDYDGITHVLPMAVVSASDFNKYRFGSLAFTGWKKMAARVPKSIPQQQTRYSLQDHRLKFIKFVVRTSPYERVDDYYIYFDQMEATVDYPATNFYDGKELSQPDLIQEIWQENGSGSVTEGQ